MNWRILGFFIRSSEIIIPYLLEVNNILDKIMNMKTGMGDRSYFAIAKSKINGFFIYIIGGG